MSDQFVTMKWYYLTKWDKRFAQLAGHVSHWSKDRRCKVGAVLVGTDKRLVSLGYNGPPPGVRDEAVMYRTDKNDFIVHAERNAIDNAHFDTRGSTLYATRPLCCGCACAALSAGVSRVVCPEIDANSKWFESQSKAFDLLTWANVDLTFWQWDLRENENETP